jgi:hypothetical protein
MGGGRAGAQADDELAHPGRFARAVPTVTSKLPRAAAAMAAAAAATEAGRQLPFCKKLATFFPFLFL